MASAVLAMVLLGLHMLLRKNLTAESHYSSLAVEMKRICSGELGDSAKAIEITGAQVQAWLAQVSDLRLNTITFSEYASIALRLENPITPLWIHYVCLRV